MIKPKLILWCKKDFRRKFPRDWFRALMDFCFERVGRKTFNARENSCENFEIEIEVPFCLDCHSSDSRPSYQSSHINYGPFKEQILSSKTELSYSIHTWYTKKMHTTFGFQVDLWFCSGLYFFEWNGTFKDSLYVVL